MRIFQKIKQNLKQETVIVGNISTIQSFLQISKDSSRSIVSIIAIDTFVVPNYFTKIPVIHITDNDKINKIFQSNKHLEVLFAFDTFDSDVCHKIVTLSSGIRAKFNHILFIDGKIKFRKIVIDDLLVQKSMPLDKYSITNMISNQIILVTGAGGSIGSELCRQIASYNPKLIVFYDITELFLFNLESQFQHEYPNIEYKSILGDIRHKDRLEWVISFYKPSVIFHAAAYKHVPMMESNPSAAIHNNIKGTWHIANLALKYKVARFVLISTDKACKSCKRYGG